MGWKRTDLWIGIADLIVGLLALGAIWVLLPARWWPVDVFGTLLALAFLGSGFGLIRATPWAERVARVVGVVALACGSTLVTALAITAGWLSGLYGPVGGGGALILAAVAALLVPYLVLFPAAQVFVMLRRTRDAKAR